MSQRTFFPCGVFAPFFEGTGPTFPDYDLVSIDDEQVKGVIATMGLGLPLLNPTPPRPKGQFRCEVMGRHATHWLAVARFEHYPSSKDNGFVLKGWAKSKRTFDQFHAEFTHWATEGGQTAINWYDRDSAPKS